MDNSAVLLKATTNGLVLVMREQDDFDTITGNLEKKLQSAGRFFNGASFSIRYRGRKLSVEEKKSLWNFFERKTGAVVESFEEDAVEEKSQEAERDPEINKPQAMKKFTFFSGIDEGYTRFYKGTARSGNKIISEGNLVVIGDVNPGAEVVAKGNIVVMGSLRGLVHAGSDGNKAAYVTALYLNPVQLRIADVITRSPDEKESRQLIPEIAFIKDGNIYIERFLSTGLTK